MRIIKSMRTGVLHRTFLYRRRHFFAASVLWGFRLDSGDNVIEPYLWEAIAGLLETGEPFDQAMPKGRAEWLVNGCFHAPGGKPVTGGGISVTLGSRHKELAVTGDRNWLAPGATPPEPFTEMPIDYRHAFGGEGFKSNPVGKGYRPVEADTGEAHPLPNVEYPDQAVASPADRPRPAAFGRIDVMWEQRFRYSGTYDDQYLQQAFMGLPDDIDWRFFNDAAEDQWLDGDLRGDEAFEIVNMSPDMPRIRGTLPGVRGRCFIEQASDRDGKTTDIREIPLRADTVWLFPGHMCGVVIFRGTTEVEEHDGGDVRTLLAAAENLRDVPRPAGHYIDNLHKRADPEQAYKYLMQTRPLLPHGCTSEFEELASGAGHGEGDAFGDNMDAFVKNKQQEVRQQLEDNSRQLAAELEQHGIKDIDLNKEAAPSPLADTVKAYLERAIPALGSDDPAKVDPGKLIADMDLGALEELEHYLESVKDQQRDDARNRIQENIDQFERELEQSMAEAERQSLRQRIEQLKKSLEAFDAGPTQPLPRMERQLDARMQAQEQALEQQRQQLRAAMQAGTKGAEEQLRQIDDAWTQTRDRIAAAKGDMREQHRTTVHFLERSTSPHPGEEATIAARLLRAYRSAGPTAEGDYAFVDLKGHDLRGIDLREAYLEYADLSGCDLSEADLTGAVLTHARLGGTRFRNAQLGKANFGRSHIDGAVFEACDMTETIFSYCHAKNARLTDCDLRGGALSFHQAVFDSCGFEGVNLDDHTFIECDFRHCRFKRCTLNDATFIQQPRLEGARFVDSELARVSVLAAQSAEARFVDCNMVNARFMGGCQLQAADFSGSILDEATFRDASIAEADFSGTQIGQSDFSNVDATGARFDRAIGRRSLWYQAHLQGASLNAVDLMEGSLHKAVLTRADFTGANLYAVNLLHVTVGETGFRDCNLTKTLLQDWRPLTG